MRERLAARLLASTVLGCLLLGSGAARAQLDSREGIELQNQILELRRDMQVLQDQVSANAGNAPIQVAPQAQANPPSGDLAASLLSRVQALEDQVRTLTGQVQELQNGVSQQNADIKKQLDDLNFKLRAGGASGGTAGPLAGADVAPPPVPLPSGEPPAEAQRPSVPPQEPAAPPRRTPEMALQEGNAALSRRDYAGAAAAAHEVLSSGHSPRQADAAFLLGQSDAGLGKPQQAAIDYYDAYQRAPKGFRAPDSLLGVANALIALNDHKAACQALDKMRAEFPAPRSDVREAAAGARGRAGCGR